MVRAPTRYQQTSTAVPVRFLGHSKHTSNKSNKSSTTSTDSEIDAGHSEIDASHAADAAH